jgi:hypothetical protein
VGIASGILGIQQDGESTLSDVLMTIANAFNFSFAGHYSLVNDNWSPTSAVYNGFYYGNPHSLHLPKIQPGFKIANRQLKQVSASHFPFIFKNHRTSILKSNEFGIVTAYSLPGGIQYAVLCLSREPAKTWNQHKSAHLALLIGQLALFPLFEKDGAVLLQFPLNQLHHQIRNGLNAIRMLVDALFAQAEYSEKSVEFRNHIENQIDLMADFMNRLPRGSNRIQTD